MIADILNEFDFDRVHRAMLCLGWEWYYYGIPTIDKLRDGARERMDNAIKGCLEGSLSDTPYYSSSGGLKATVEKNNYGQIDFIELEFVLTSWDTTDDI
jgi:hypothetical protein